VDGDSQRRLSLRLDGYYAMSKCYPEMLARMYWEKHAIESVLIRIGSLLPEAPDERILTITAASGARMREGTSARRLESSDDQAERARRRLTNDPVAERYQDRQFVSVDFARKEFAPNAMPRGD